ncbi:MAG: TrkA family potassium uptake protein [Bacteroidetes bacterium]|nr:MAG: TrkA family potassium uptake protein [Bacteroidota bacterium]
MFSKKINLIITLIGFLLFIMFSWLLLSFEKGDETGSIKSISDVLWYAIITLTTVGYGDYFPVTQGGKIISLFFVISSLGVLGFFISRLTNKIQNHMELKKNGHFGTNFENHFVIFGWNTFGQYVVEQIIKANSKVAIITDKKKDIDIISNTYSNDNLFVLFSDYKNFEEIKKANVDKASTLFVNFNSDTDTLVYLVNLKKHFPDINYVVSLNNPDLKETYKTIGTTYVISKNEIASKLVASYIFEPDVAEFTEDIIATSDIDDEFDFLQYEVTATNPYLGMKYIDVFIAAKKELNAIVLGLSSNVSGKRILHKNPKDDTIINKGDYILIISDGNSKKQVESTFGVKEGRRY